MQTCLYHIVCREQSRAMSYKMVNSLDMIHILGSPQIKALVCLSLAYSTSDTIMQVGNIETSVNIAPPWLEAEEQACILITLRTCLFDGDNDLGCVGMTLNQISSKLNIVFTPEASLVPISAPGAINTSVRRLLFFFLLPSCLSVGGELGGVPGSRRPRPWFSPTLVVWCATRGKGRGQSARFMHSQLDYHHVHKIIRWLEWNFVQVGRRNIDNTPVHTVGHVSPVPSKN